MDTLIYEHKTQGRTLYSLAFLIAAIVVVLGGSNTGLPIYAYMPPGFVLLFGAWWFMSNPNHGCRLTKTELAFWTNKDRQSIAVADIASAEEPASGDNSVLLVLKDGKQISLSSSQVGNSGEFVAALGEAGIKPAS